LEKQGETVPSDLKDWQIKRVLDSLERFLDARVSAKAMPHRLAESVQSHWPSFTAQIRTVRNDAGHPADIDLVTHERVQGALLTFPELAVLAAEVIEWLEGGMQK
jgi:hypothetical protein